MTVEIGVRTAAYITALVFLTVCARVPPTLVEQVAQVCPAERPEICTMIYDPVCALTKDGQSVSQPSDCRACSDINVVGYNVRACEASESE